jgi:hypothetical protein
VELSVPLHQTGILSLGQTSAFLVQLLVLLSVEQVFQAVA